MLESRALSLTVLLTLSLAACPKQGGSTEPAPEEQPVACTMDAKLCPDGSAVGRQGPNCEFAPCPGEAPAPAPE